MNIYTLILAGGLAAGSLAAIAAVPGAGGRKAIQGIPEHNIDLERMMPVRKASAFAGGAKSPSRVAAAPRPGFELRGSLIGADGWGEKATGKPYGIYSVTVAPGEPLAVKSVALDNRLNATTGAVMTPKGYYVISTTPYMGYYLVDYQLFDPSDWSLVSKSAADMESMARSLAYNPADGLIYGSFANLDGTFSFSSLDMKKGTRKKIVARMENPYSALAADEEGTLYGIDPEGDLVRIDVKNGEAEKLHETGLPSAYTTSAVYDGDTGAIYYVQAREDASELFAIDPADGSVLSFGEFAGGEQWGGLYIPEAAAADAAPAGAVLTEAKFEEGNLQGTVSFTAPELLFGGEAAEGEMRWRVAEGEETVASGTCLPGERVETEVTVEKPGLYTFTVTLANEEGDSPASSVTVAVGPDVPLGVENIAVSSDESGEKIRLTWEAPRGGENGGWINGPALTYDIVRYPGGEKAAEGVADTEWSETLPRAEALTVLRYGVTAVNDGIRGAETLSAPMPLGNIGLPYEVDFHFPGALDAFHIIDANGDGITWTPDEKHGAYVDYSDRVMNDWLISSPVEMKKGMVYKVTIDAWSQSVRHDERIALWIGGGMDVASMTKRLTMRSLDGHPAPITVPVTVEKDGFYNIGIQGCSGAGQYVLRLGSLAISEPVAQTAPDAPRILSITPDGQGELSVEGRILLPTKAYEGSQLTGLTSFALKRGEEEVMRVENPLPGQIVTFEDYPEKGGRYTYTAVAESEAGKGVEMKGDVYVGVNIPANPGWVTHTLNEDGTGTLTWGIVSGGADGLQLNTTDVSYRVYDRDFNELGATDGTSMDVASPEAINHCSPLADIFYVRAETRAGLNPTWDCTTNILNYGVADHGVLSIPADRLSDHCVGMTERDGMPTGSDPWEVETDESGRVRLTASPTAEGETHLLVLPSVTLGEDSPALTFATEGEAPQKITLHLLQEMPLGAISVNPQGSDDGEGDRVCRVELGNYAGKTVNPVISLASAAKISIKRILVDCVKPCDVRIEKLEAEPTHAHGTVVMKARVRNAGTASVGPFSVRLECSYDYYGEVIPDDYSAVVDEANVEGMEPGETRIIELRAPFEQYRYRGLTARAEIRGIEENVPEFNKSEEVSVIWADKGLPVPRNVTASQAEGMAAVDVMWDTPEGVIVKESVLPTDGKAAGSLPILTGYKVYADRYLVFECGNDCNGFMHVLPYGMEKDEVLETEYTVVGCYGDEESVPGGPAVVRLTGVESIGAEDGGMRICGDGETFFVYGAEGAVEVYTPAGLHVMRAEARQGAPEAPLRLDLTPGVYIITDGKTTLRVSF